MLTRLQIRAYCRGETGQLDSAKVEDLQINQYINFGQIEVQNEFAEVGFKAFTNKSFQTGHIFAEPSDLLQYPNSIINLLAGTGVKGTHVNTLGATGTMTITAREPGTWANTWTGQLTNTGSVSVSINFTTKVITMGNNATVTTIAVLIAALNADPIFSAYFVASGTATSETILNASFNYVLAGGTGDGWYPADEVSHENFVRIEANSFKAPSTTSPKYRRIYNGTSKTIEILPNTVSFAALEYYRRLADLTADTESMTVPAEIEELVILKVITKIYDKVGDVEKMNASLEEYAAQFNKITGGYVKKRQSEMTEKKRMQSADVEN